MNVDRVTTAGHAAIYLGNDQYIHAPGRGKYVTTAAGASKRFTHVFRFT